MSSTPSCGSSGWQRGLSAELRFLLVCCKAQPCATELIDAAKAVSDWHALVRAARHHLLVPQLRRHIALLPADICPADALSSLAAVHKDVTRRTLLQAAELKYLAEHHLAPTGIPYLTVKGLTLASRYHGQLMGRQGRDIDLLIEPTRIHELTVRLIAHGYRLKAAPEVQSPEDLQAFCAMEHEVSLFSPRGVLIELHSQLDATGSQYPMSPAASLALAEPVPAGEQHYPALPTVELFLYICYHHSQHQWSRLHWVSDLDAMIRHPSFDRARLRQRAAELGMTRLLDAVLALHSVLLDGHALAAVQAPFARRLIEDCLHFLREGSTTPEDVRRTLSLSRIGMIKVRAKIFQFNWGANTRSVNRLRYLLSLAKGSYADYRFLPLPPTLQPLYSIVRPVRWLSEAIPHRKASGISPH